VDLGLERERERFEKEIKVNYNNNKGGNLTKKINNK
jgi:hypothetical protein